MIVERELSDARDMVAQAHISVDNHPFCVVITRNLLTDFTKLLEKVRLQMGKLENLEKDGFTYDETS